MTSDRRLCKSRLITEWLNSLTEFNEASLLKIS